MKRQKIKYKHIILQLRPQYDQELIAYLKLKQSERN